MKSIGLLILVPRLPVKHESLAGAAALTDEELVAAILGMGTKGTDVHS